MYNEPFFSPELQLSIALHAWRRFVAILVSCYPAFEPKLCGHRLILLSAERTRLAGRGAGGTNCLSKVAVAYPTDVSLLDLAVTEIALLEEAH
jgi:hypothetical protein